MFFGQLGCLFISFVFCEVEPEEFGAWIFFFTIYTSAKQLIHILFWTDKEGRGEICYIVLVCIFCCFHETHTITRITSIRSLWHVSCDREDFFFWFLCKSCLDCFCLIYHSIKKLFRIIPIFYYFIISFF